ncbi:hypothetical protein MUG91_G5n35 [Manis pentadactyla]|nr:hypothetical protein MUG91_G5n35 [Manis pentadactyla]
MTVGWLLNCLGEFLMGLGLEPSLKLHLRPSALSALADILRTTGLLVPSGLDVAAVIERLKHQSTQNCLEL